MEKTLSILWISGLMTGLSPAQTVLAQADYRPSLAYQSTPPQTPINPASSFQSIQSGTAASASPRAPQDKPYKRVTVGLYGGINGTNLSGLDRDGSHLQGRSGYQFGAFLRAGGRLFGQAGAEYFASSSDYFVRGNGASISDITDKVNVKYLQVPVYIGYKLLESDRGLSAIRLQAGAEYANRLSADSNTLNLSESAFKSGTFNALGQLGFDFGPLLTNVTYHHGLGNSIENNTGFAESKRRVISISAGFKF